MHSAVSHIPSQSHRLEPTKLYKLKKKKDFIYSFLDGGGEREGEKHQCVVASHKPPTGDLACNPGMCPE